MAQARLESPKEQEVAVEFSYDDPIEVTLNGASLFTDMTLRKTFTTVSTPAFLRAGENRILVRMADTPGSNVGWAGFSMRVLDASGEDITLSLQPPLAEGGQAAQEASPE
jgi:hypothetical protein